ncbi:D-alanyl-D-alanine carboxypeptidase family protein [Methylophilus aquaticus]|uniref:serine-type D-Ala-D-Ala carboxypeptidase n=1 Tax=Methylophilus aquaticus TaxID=1971610 RepID=A0ABT9JP22_9PROT|nr:D-alanyl-D-alanine carboxypeptidase family protein [Methylophilus aquaticus]MDP8566330.1 D-alanyl-D-alanine carboxypeptidase family protein [Methylophilus aquaticus]
MWRFYFAVLFVFPFSVLAAEAISVDVPAPTLAAKAFVLRDANTGNLLAANQPDMPVEPASLTKVMTAYLTFEAVKQKRLSLTQALPVSHKAWKVEGSKMFIDTTMTVTVDELLHGLIIQSGNDAAITLAEGIAGSEELFAALMNKKAALLGMNNSHFMNATGLPDPAHMTTARDLSILANALIRDFPQDYKRLYSQKEYTYNKITQPNRNRLLFLDPTVDGMKTGHTESAGYCLISSAKRDDFRLISVVLGTASDNVRAAESQKLLNFGFQFYESKTVYQAGAKVSTQKVWKGTENSIDLTVSKPVYFTMPRGEYPNMKASLRINKPLEAPLKARQVVGQIEFSLNGKVVRSVPLVTAHAVEASNIFARMIDQVRLYLQ